MTVGVMEGTGLGVSVGSKIGVGSNPLQPLNHNTRIRPRQSNQRGLPDNINHLVPFGTH
jgi:hypothetical protein